MTAKTAWRGWRREVHDLLEVGGDAHPAGRLVNAFIIVLIILNAIAFAAETVPALAVRYAVELRALQRLLGDRVHRRICLEGVERRRDPDAEPAAALARAAAICVRPMMVIDLLAFCALVLALDVPDRSRVLWLFRLFRLLKLVRYSPALQTLGRVIADENRALFGALLVIHRAFLSRRPACIILEREAQPDKFGSIPDAAWWALATLTTVGYGDVVPVTPWGKLLGGVVMLLGVGMFALPGRHLATGFSQESSRHQFVVTWCMVARVPLFASMDEAEVAEITKLLYYANLYARRSHGPRA